MSTMDSMRNQEIAIAVAMEVHKSVGAEKNRKEDETKLQEHSHVQLQNHVKPHDQRIQELNKKQADAMVGGGDARIASQHKKGKFTARERIDLLVDPGSFEEFDMFRIHHCTNFGMADEVFYGDGVVTGTAEINGRKVCLYAQDFTVQGGSISKVHAEKICKIMDFAAKTGMPIIGMNDSGGARVQEGVDSLAGYGGIFLRNVRCSGVVPQIVAILGPCAGGAVYSPAIQDFIVMNKTNSYMFVTGPKVVKTVLQEDVSVDGLGGSGIHAEKSGVSHFVGDDEAQSLRIVKELLSYLPANNREMPPTIATDDPADRLCPQLLEIVPESSQRPYDMHRVIAQLVDDGKFLESLKQHAMNIITGFARFNGKTVGIVANQPSVISGVLDIGASAKAARFVRFCDAFNIPLLTLEDTPGFMPGTYQEHNGIIRHGAKLMYAYAEATVPKITIIIRKAYGGAYIVMNSQHLGADAVFAWPTAEIAVMGSKGAVEVMFRREADSSPNAAEYLLDKEREYNETFLNPYRAAEDGYIEDVIDPQKTRVKIIRTFERLLNKDVPRPQRKHGNIPL
jgi:methylmalonyl-CoA decarboxylase subunit alpha